MGMIAGRETSFTSFTANSYMSPQKHQFDRFAQYKTDCNSRSEWWLGGWGLGQQVKRTIQVISLQTWTDFIFLHKILDFKRGRAGP